MQREIKKIFDTLSLFPYNTQRTYKNALREYLQFTNNNLDKTLIQDYINYIAKRNNASSVKLKYYALKKIFKILNDPISFEVVLPREIKKEPITLTEKQLDLYYKAVKKIKNKQVRTILELLPRTGLRISELLNLTVDDIKKENDIYYLRIKGKANRIRKVVLGNKAKEILLDYLSWNHNTDKIFTVTDELVRYYLRRLRKSLNIPNLTPHTLRHTFASLLLQNGVDVKTISELLGHHSVVFTLKTYCHTTLEQKQKAVNILD